MLEPVVQENTTFDFALKPSLFLKLKLQAMNLDLLLFL